MFVRPAFLIGDLLISLFLLFNGAALAQPGGKSVVVTERTRAELIAHAPDGIQPGKPVSVGLQLAHQPEWHSYWKNSGDSGLPTQLEWTLPAGVLAGEIAWPTPRKHPIGTLINYGYEHTVLLSVPLTITPDFKPSLLASALDVKLKATWLVCRKECIPEEGEFSLSIPTQSATALHGPLFEASLAAQPKPLAGQATAAIENNALQVRVNGLPPTLRGKLLEFFPETAEVIETSAKWTQRWEGHDWTAQVPLSPHRTRSPGVMPIVLTLGSEGWSIDAKVQGTWPATAAPAAISPALEQALRNNTAASTRPGAGGLTLTAALLGALLGGLILNLMPCVFPVLAIKVLGFTRHGVDQRTRRLDGLAYTSGVVLSFAALGMVVAGLRAAGEQVGWGFQLQSPGVVAALAALFTLMALNLAGVFEFGRLLPSSITSLEAKHPTVNAFLSGVLAVAIASPCTAPFMGAALGVAITLPMEQAVLIFAALGLGMAAPYLAASCVPGVARMLPAPGEWLVTLRKFMAFPMLAAVIWLVWVLGQQAGVDAVAALLALLLAISMLAWALGVRGGRPNALSALALVSVAGLLWVTAGQIAGAQQPSSLAANPSGTTGSGEWEAWQPQRVEQILATGRPVFVDFTAAWCVTCQYNKKTTLADESVVAEMKRKNVALLRADWTRRDPAITAALAQLGRTGVPLYVLYSKQGPPRILSEILSPTEIHEALAGL